MTRRKTFSEYSVKENTSCNLVSNETSPFFALTSPLTSSLIMERHMSRKDTSSNDYTTPQDGKLGVGVQLPGRNSMGPHHLTKHQSEMIANDKKKRPTSKFNFEMASEV